ncbi:MAG: deoxyhypusine synthase [Candidatus Aenigmatarchaeota archaeon]|nr:MAG: deoxyhypusine synthase [Candidatus Aenigmarchaeota archaeon]
MNPVKDIAFTRDTNDLIKQFSESGGFTAKKLADGVDILETASKECTLMLSFPAALIATGTRGVVRDLVKNKLVSAIMTTSGTLDHDLARLWQDYYHGSFDADDAELHRKGINRLGNIFVPNESYGEVLEQKLQPMFKRLYDEGLRDFSTRELVWKVGEHIANEKKAEESITYWAWKNKIPIFVPGPADGAFGYQLWLFWQDGHKDFTVNVLKDESELNALVHDAKKLAALMIGGGISKHHTIWWSQFRGGLDYAVQITSAVEWDGSLSGARTREAVSWGKIKEKAKHVTIEGDASVLLPLMVSALMQRLNI